MVLTLDEVLDGFEHLPAEQQAMLLEIIRQRQSAQQRHQIAQNAQHSMDLHRAGKLRPGSAEDIIRSLRAALAEPDDEA